MPEFPISNLIELTVLSSLYKFVWDGFYSSRAGNQMTETSLHASRPIDTRSVSRYIILAKLMLGRIIGPCARLYLCYVNSQTRARADWTTGASLHALYYELVCKVKARDALRG
ncbi:hypothetical protein ACS0PU_001707 [Formica fusca]